MKRIFILKRILQDILLLAKRGEYYWCCIILANDVFQSFAERNVYTQFYCQNIDKKERKELEQVL